MRFHPALAIMTVGLAVAAAGLVAAACSSSTAVPPPGDGGAPSPAFDAGPAVGAQCATTNDCPEGGVCSNSAYAKGNPIYPTPICLAACTPSASASQGLATCGSETLPGAGLCEPQSSSGTTGGLCLPFCQVTPFGTVIGCAANDVCQLLGSTGPDGAGWCQPGCTSSSQCPAGSVCDPLLAACDTNPIQTTLPIGAVCSLSANPPPCNCVGSQTATQGYCTAACVTGATVCPTPPEDGGSALPDAGDAGAGSAPWVCSAGLNFVTLADGGAIFTTQPPGLFGFCAPACNSNADCAAIQGTCAVGDPAAPPGYEGTCVTGS